MTDLERYNKDKALVMSIIKYILLFLIGVAVIYGLTKLLMMMIPFLVGFLLAKSSHMISDPICNLLGIDKPSKKSKPIKVKPAKKRNWFMKIISPEPKPKKSGRTVAATITYAILLVLVLLVCAWAALALISQANNAVSKIANIARNLDYDSLGMNELERFSTENGGWLSPEVITLLQENIYTLANNAMKFIPTVLTSTITFVLDIISSLPTVLFIVICVILSGFYFINDGPSVAKLYLKSVPNKDFRKKSFNLINDLSDTVFKVLAGYLFLLVVTAVEAGIVLYLADVDYIVILAIITGLIDFLPVLGISATMVPVMGYCAFHGNYKAVVIIIIGMAIMTVVRRILEPLVLGKSMKLHPLLMLIAMVIGMYVWGAIGFLLGPTAMIIIIQVMKVFNLDKKAQVFLSKVLHRFMAAPEEEA
ncbi:MAG: AI-2E family transporter [Clostridia bacterium]|nr:AI-2E family transporter [Clostridia bacterium]